MTTIILTIIGILLAAAAALMVVFYGGTAFEDGSVGAAANTLQNAGSNVISASSMYKMKEQATPTAISDLTTGGVYMSEAPSIEGVGTSASIASGYYDVIGVSTEVCEAVNGNLGLGAPAASRPATAKMGCYTDATNGETFFAKL